MTTATAAPDAPAKALAARKSTKLQGLQVFMENKLAVFGVCLLLILLAFSFIGPMFYVTDQVHTDLSISAGTIGRASARHGYGRLRPARTPHEGRPDLDHRRLIRRHHRDHGRHPVRRVAGSSVLDRRIFMRIVDALMSVPSCSSSCSSPR